MIDFIDPDNEDNYEDESGNYSEAEAGYFYDEPSDEPIWEPNEYYTDPMYGSDTY